AELVLRLYFFFSSRRRHTRFSRDWSSDVCSSDLKYRRKGRRTKKNAPQGAHSLQIGEFRALRKPKVAVVETAGDGDDRPGDKIGVRVHQEADHPGDVPAGSRSADGIAVIPFSAGGLDGRLLVGIANVPRTDHVDGDPVRCLFLRQGPGEGDQPRLGRRIGGETRPRRSVLRFGKAEGD